MSLKDDWKDLENAVPGVPDSGSDINADIINMIANQVILNEEAIGTANAELESILAGGVD